MGCDPRTRDPDLLRRCGVGLGVFRVSTLRVWVQRAADLRLGPGVASVTNRSCLESIRGVAFLVITARRYYQVC